MQGAGQKKCLIHMGTSHTVAQMSHLNSHELANKRKPDQSLKLKCLTVFFFYGFKLRQLAVMR